MGAARASSGRPVMDRKMIRKKAGRLEKFRSPPRERGGELGMLIGRKSLVALRWTQSRVFKTLLREQGSITMTSRCLGSGALFLPKERTHWGGICSRDESEYTESSTNASFKEI